MVCIPQNEPDPPTRAAAPSSPYDGPAMSRFLHLLDTAPDAIVVVRRDGCIDLVNRQAETLFGWPREDLIDQPLSVLIPERFRATHHQHLERYLDHPAVRPMGSGMQLFGVRRDGTELPVEVSLSPVDTEEGSFVSAAIRDMTERRRLETELRLARAAAEEGSRAKSDFLASMSHELRTPMNAILGFAQLLQRDRKEPPTKRQLERVEHILRGGEHLLRLIDDVLDLARIEAGGVSVSIEPISLPEVVDEAVASLSSTAERAGVRIDVEPPQQGLPMVAADRTRLTQMLMNFGSNAVKYNRAGGNVVFAAVVVDHIVRISVADTGMGIPLDKQAMLFQPFQRAGQETGPIEGTGIGLAITKRLAALTGATVGFRSVPGHGSTFWVDVPQSAGRRPPATPDVRTAEPRATLERRRVVLYVEDNLANVVFMRDLLESFDNLALLSASTAEQGIEMAREHVPDVIIMDINLPGMSGLDALKALQQLPETKGIPVLALTAAATARDRALGAEAGFVRYLTKPIKVDELETCLTAVLGKT